MQKSFYLAIALLFIPAADPGYATELRTGDIIFQESYGTSFSQAIKLAAHSRYSHMGVIIVRKGKPTVFEAAGSVKYTPLERWIEQGKNRHYVVKRLANSRLLQDPVAVRKFVSLTTKFFGRPYDSRFQWGDEKLYCSELVSKMFDQALGVKIGPLKTFANFDLSHPIVKQEIRKQYGSHFKLSEPLVAPSDILRSDLLITISKKN